MRKEFSGDFWTETQFVHRRICGGSVQKLLKIASAVLSLEWRLRYLCIVKIKPWSATREVGNQWQKHNFRVKVEEYDNYFSLICKFIEI